jgi:hypothetical protein
MGDGRQMQTNTPPKPSVFKRVTDELKEVAVIAIYLFVCFTAILYLKASILKAQGVEFAPLGIAAIKALVCAKFVSLGYIFRVGQGLRSLPLIWQTLYRSFAFLILLLVLNAFEQIIEGLIHHKSLADSLSEFGGGTLDELIATSIVGWLILIPFVAFRALGEILGEGNLVKLFFFARHEKRELSADERIIVL